jgi:uncharacterized protein (DUF1501 family)
MDTRMKAGDPMQGGGQKGAATGALAAKMLLGDGARIAMIETTGWDTHSGQRGRLNAQLRDLDRMMAALKAGLGPEWANTLVVVATEFGRTARPNGSGGTDHGTATAVFLGGGAVDGKRVIAQWPGLEFAQLYQNRDLAPTTDFRAVAKGVLSAHLGIPQDALSAVVFPQSAGVAPLKELLRA